MERVQRIKYGEEKRRFDTADKGLPCHDCNAVLGDYHLENCDAEECPVCGGQFFICGCGKNEHNKKLIYGDIIKTKQVPSEVKK